MALLSKATGKSGFEPVPEGAHLARCITVVDLGLQESIWSGITSFKLKVYIAFEVPSVRVEWEKDDEKHEGPALIGQMYTNSIGDKATLGKHLTSWRGKSFTDDEKLGFDLFTILDVPCQISVVHNTKGENTYANISGIMGLPPGVEVPPRETPLLAYSPHDPERAGNFDQLPEWLQEKCTIGHRNSEQGNEVMTENPAPQGQFEQPPFDDDLPF
jgi:hypothetical protein